MFAGLLPGASPDTFSFNPYNNLWPLYYQVHFTDGGTEAPGDYTTCLCVAECTRRCTPKGMVPGGLLTTNCVTL